MVLLSKVNSKIPPKALALRDQSLSVHGGKLFNLIPKEILVLMAVRKDSSIYWTIF